MTEFQHLPVMLAEVLVALAIKPDGIYVDATFGRGGHTRAILEKLGPHGRLYAIDCDAEAVRLAQAQLARDTRFAVVKGRFSMLSRYVESWGIESKVDGIVLDLGVSSPQLDDGARGFSFRREGPLDMRMEQDVGVSAQDWINNAEPADIARILRTLGEERFAMRIARAIVNARAQQGISTTTQLAALVAAAVPTREVGKDPATRSFQAIRMHINRELEELEAVLPQVLTALAAGGRVAVISFHSLEDRIAKNFIRTHAKGDAFPVDLPVTHAMLQPTLRAVGKAQYPSAAETARNPRARSAVLRVAERVRTHT